MKPADVMALISRYGAWPERDPAADAWVFAYTDGAGTQHEVWYPDAATIARVDGQLFRHYGSHGGMSPDEMEIPILAWSA